MRAGVPPLRVLSAGLLVTLTLGACGTPAPSGPTLLRQSSQHMLNLKGFHFQMNITGTTGADEPVQSAQGDARPPDLRARVNLAEGGVLLEVEVIFASNNIYLKSFTGGWQQLTPAQIAAFFDARTLFDPQSGLFAAMRDTTAPYVGKTETVSSHDTYPVDGVLAATRVHELLSLIRDQGSYHVTYWIENSSANLWRAKLTGNLFDPAKSAAITFDFSNHDHPVSISPPPLG